MSKVKVLAVAPYEGMKDVIASVVAARDDVEVTTVVGNMERGAAIVKICDQGLYDVIISRGGTAKLVRDVANIPVIEIELTPYDIRNALAAVSGRKSKFAVAGFPSIAEAARTLCDIMNIGIDIVTIHDNAEAARTLPQLKQRGVELLLCDMVGVEAAPAVGLETVLITSGVKGIEDALNKAVTYFSSFGRAKLASEIQAAEMQAVGQSMAVLSVAGQVVFAAPEPAVQPAVRKLLYRMVPTVLADGGCMVSRPIGNKDYAILGTPIIFNGEQCVAFRLRSEGFRLPVSTPGVSSYSASQRDIVRISRHYADRDRSLLDRAEKIAQSGLPAVICGEQGTLVDSMAGYIGMQGLLSERDCSVIDCAAVGAKGWGKLLGQSGLLSFRTGTSILFKNLLDMTDSAIDNLIDFIQASDLTDQLRVLFAVTTGVFPQRENKIIKMICDRLYGVVFRLPPLRERKEELPALLENCFTYACAEMGIRMPEIGEDALQLLLRYSWPRNYPQMFRTVTQLLVDCKGGEIGKAQIEALLGFENRVKANASESEDRLDLRGTLEDINYRVVMQVLAEEGMNRSLTAKRLGISRATLWRILNRSQD